MWGAKLDELEILRSKASSLIKHSDDDLDSLIKAADLLKDVEEIEHRRAATHKLCAESPQSRVLQFLSVLAPVATVAVLAVTLIFSVVQFRSGRRDAQWAEAVKSVTEEKIDAVAAAEIQGLRQLPDYKQKADDLAQDLLRRTSRPDTFRSLFETEFGKSVKWDDLARILELDRSLTMTHTFLESKKTKLSSDEIDQKESVKQELTQICNTISPLLKSSRPSGATLNLHNVEFLDCDLSDADLSGADLTGFNTSRINLKGANFAEITKYEGGFWGKTAWWEAGKMSPRLVAYLDEHWKFDPKQSPENYGLQSKPTKDEYDKAVDRLRHSIVATLNK
jgi:hypothetical protein